MNRRGSKSEPAKKQRARRMEALSIQAQAKSRIKRGRGKARNVTRKNAEGGRSLTKQNYKHNTKAKGTRPNKKKKKKKKKKKRGTSRTHKREDSIHRRETKGSNNGSFRLTRGMVLGNEHKGTVTQLKGEHRGW